MAKAPSAAAHATVSLQGKVPSALVAAARMATVKTGSVAHATASPAGLVASAAR